MDGDGFSYLGPTSRQLTESAPTEGQLKDESSLGTLEKMRLVIDGRKAHYGSIRSIDIHDGALNSDQQIAVNQRLLVLITELEQLLFTGINNVKERNNG